MVGGDIGRLVAAAAVRAVVRAAVWLGGHQQHVFDGGVDRFVLGQELLCKTIQIIVSHITI